MGEFQVKIVEVGPRDGLQNEARLLALPEKIRFVKDLLAAGIPEIELGAFVRPDRVPQMADTEEIYRAVHQQTLNLGKAKSWSLVPNLKGLERAIASGVSRIAIFTAATDGFALRNIGRTVDQSLEDFGQVMKAGRKAFGTKFRARGYISTAFGCPFEGRVVPSQPMRVLERLLEIGVQEVSIGDTIGVAHPGQVKEVITAAKRLCPIKKLGVHFHDTRGTALANALRAMDLGVRIIDSSAGGLGGCPFAPGAAGNLATEDLVYMLDGMGVKTGVNLELLCKASLALSQVMGRPLTSKYLQTFAATLGRS